MDAARQLKLLQNIANEMRNVHKIAADMGMTETELAFFNLLSSEGGDKEILQVSEDRAHYGKEEGPKKELAGLILESLETLAVIDWTHKEDVQREMRRKIKRHLRASGYGFDEIEALTSKLMDLARVRLGR